MNKYYVFTVFVLLSIGMWVMTFVSMMYSHWVGGSWLGIASSVMTICTIYYGYINTEK